MTYETSVGIPMVFEDIESLVHIYLQHITGSNSMFSRQDEKQPIVQHFLSHLIFWLYKDVYYDSAARYTTGTLSGPRSQETFEASRRTLERNIKKAVARKRAEAAANGTTTEYYDLIGRKEQRKQEISPVYHLANLDYKAVQQYGTSTRDLLIVDLLANKRINNSKVVGGQMIVDAYAEYFQYIQNGAQQEKADQWIEALIDLSNLESQMAPGFLYAVAKYAEDYNINPIPSKLMILFGMHVSSIKIADSIIKTPVCSRFLFDRMAYIAPFFQENSKDYEELFGRLLTLQWLVLGKNRINGEKLAIFERMPILYDCLGKVTPSDAAKYFKEKYNLFDVYNFAELADSSSWTSKLLKVYRDVVATLTTNSKSCSDHVPRSK